MLSRYHLHSDTASVSSYKCEYIDSFKYDIDGTCHLQVFLEVCLVTMRLSTQRHGLKCVCAIELVSTSGDHMKKWCPQCPVLNSTLTIWCVED